MFPIHISIKSTKYLLHLVPGKTFVGFAVNFFSYDKNYTS